MRKKFYPLLLLLLPAFAGKSFGMVVESGHTIIIDHPVSQDLYLAGGTIVINAPVHGDLLVAGGKVYINDTVTRDVLIVGGTVVMKGYVGGKVRCLGGNVRLDDLLQGDLLVGGGDISVEKGCIVAGSVLAGGGRLTLYGEVKEDVRVYAEKFLLYGPVGRDLECRGGTISIHGRVGGESKLSASDRLEIGYSAEFNGPVRYWSRDSVNFGTSLRAGQAIRDESLSIRISHWYFLGASEALIFLWYLGMALAFIILLQYLIGPAFQRAGDMVYEHTSRSFGTGLVFFLGTPLLIAMAIASLVVMPVGFFLLFGYIFILLTSGSISSLVAAHWFNSLMGGKGKFWEQVGMAFVFFILLRLILSIPLFGWILYPILICIAVGALTLANIPKKKSSGAGQNAQV
jgi:cytoskeletal protein CcmA (bactofilin family)